MDSSYYTPIGTGISNSSKTYGLEITSYLGGNLVSIRKKKNYQNTQFPTGGNRKPRTWKRGKCVGQSRQSKRRFERTCNKINRNKLDQVEKFITITYSEVPDDWKIVKNHLHRFQKWMKYHYPKSTGFWKIEDQELRSSREGEPDICFHFHFLVYNLDFLPNDKLNQWWNRTTGSEVEQRTSVENVRSPQEIHNYMIKYISKQNISDKFQETELGRVWGSFNKSGLNELIDENVVFIDDDYVDPDTTQVTTMDQLHSEFKKIVLRYKDSYSRGKWGKGYKKEYHYHITKDEVVDYETGEIKVSNVYYHLKWDRIWILWNDDTLDQVIDFILKQPREKKMKQVFQDWNERGL